jgi:hypothetical protein
MGGGPLSEGERRAQRPQGLRLFAWAVALTLVLLFGTKVLLPAYLAPPPPGEREAALNSAFTSVGLALERWKAQEGDYPQRLEQLVPSLLAAIPSDPWDDEGGPLRYRARSGGEGKVLLYSVGPDSVDDGGRAAPGGSDASDRLYPVW